MRIRKIHLNNLNSLREATLDFSAPPLSNTGLFAITGDTGAGKTTILDAITLALYGKAPLKPEKEIISYGTGYALAEVEFEHGDRLFRSKWTLRRAFDKPFHNLKPPKLELAEWNSDKAVFELIATNSKVPDEVTAITGLDFNRFCQSALLAQGQFAVFLEAKNKDRGELLERMTGTELYSRIANATFLRNKQEEGNLQNLKSRIALMQVWEPEKLDELKRQITELEAQSVQQRAEQTELDAQIRLQEEVLRLNSQRTELTREHEALLAAYETAAPDLKRLELHIHSAPLHSPLQALNKQREQIELWQIRRVEEQNSLERRMVEVQAAKASLEVATQRLAEIEAFVTAQQPVWEEVSTLDIKIGEKYAEQERLRAKATQQEQQFNAKRQALRDVEKKLEDVRVNHATASLWVQENAHLEGLPGAYASLRTELLHLLENTADVQTLQKSIEGLELDRKQADIEYARIAALCDKETALLTQLLQTRTTSVENIPVNENTSPATWLLDQIEVLTFRKRQVQDFQQLQDKYSRMLQDYSAWEARLEALQAADSAASKDLLAALDALDDCAEALEYTREIFHQQQRIANYEKDRAALQEGAECPLCLSTEHPFRHKAVTPFVDKARAAFERKEQRFKGANQVYQKCLNRQREVSLALDQLRSDNTFLEEVHAIERELVTHAELLRDVALHLESAQAVATALVQIDREIQSARARLSAVQTLDQQIQNQDGKVRDAEQKRTVINQDFTRLDGMLEIKRDQLAKLQKNIALKIAALTAPLHQFRIALNPEELSSLLRHLEALNDEADTRFKEHARLAKEQDALQQEIAVHNATVAEQVQIWEEMQQELTALTRDLEALRTNRHNLFGDKNLQAERDRVQSERTRIQGIVHSESIELGKLEKNQDVLHSTVLGLDRQIEEWTVAYTQASTDLEAACHALHFSSIDTLRQAILDQETLQQLQSRKTELDRRMLENNTRLEQIKQELQAKNPLVEHLPALEVLHTRAETLKHTQKEVLEALGGCKNKLADQTEKWTQVDSLRSELELQQKEVLRWNKLNALIGSQDGASFRTFAQGLTLSNLVQRANKHLEQLSGRYIIVKKSDTDLDLSIQDTYQANSMRSMNTLSGGERFLVSLALALGLSDMAGKDIQIQSLFIDEGFGTLDDNSLDMALNTLENLQSSGKTIGVISHVKELKERIAVKIQVSKGSSGFSRVELVER